MVCRDFEPVRDRVAVSVKNAPERVICTQHIIPNADIGRKLDIFARKVYIAGSSHIAGLKNGHNFPVLSRIDKIGVFKRAAAFDTAVIDGIGLSQLCSYQKEQRSKYGLYLFHLPFIHSSTN